MKHKLVAIYRHVNVPEIDKQDTLIWNDDGFCWLYKADKQVQWQGKFSSLTEAEDSCRDAGHNPTAWHRYCGTA